MKEHLGAFEPHDLARLSDWLSETGELYTDVYWPHSAGSSVDYLVRSLPDLRKVVINHPGRELILTVFRRQFYTLRGRADNALIAQAQQLIKDGQYFEILDYDKLLDVDKTFPGMGTYLDDGNSHDELREQLAALSGQVVAVGTNPFDYEDTDDFFKRPETAWILKVAQDLSFKRNSSSYAPYDSNPEKYQPLVNSWKE